MSTPLNKLVSLLDKTLGVNAFHDVSNNGLQLALMELETQVNSIPYNATGAALIEAATELRREVGAG